MQLRYLQTLSALANDRSNTIVFPVPAEMLGALGARAAVPGDADRREPGGDART
jgi:hypothetical protein